MTLLFHIFLNLLVWGNDFSVAQQNAKQQHRLILLNFSGSDWCGPCIKLKKDVFESSEFTTFAENNLELIRADFPRLKKNQLAKDQQAKNDALAEKYNSSGKFPLTVLLNDQGKVLKEWEGYQPSLSKFLAEIKQFR
ncbi:thioredoxin family protein [Aquirufa aurantiipilula]|uniref:Thioredoxin family protein n=1 Tax=Aquirufa aurantiipilula TaxID=2696561 RepID=A0ABT6BM97_9BACT|nr:thioredoxin family protein [Aquirufa aurantiipilula]MDF5689938.1 thioredoxin family protein [Aquirufa aurantiipilula]